MTAPKKATRKKAARKKTTRKKPAAKSSQPKKSSGLSVVRARRERLKAAFLEKLEASHSPVKATRAIQVGRRTPYGWRDADPKFKEAWDSIMESQLDMLEESAMSRAINGTLKPVWYKGEQVGWERVFETGLTIFMLRTRLPERYNIPGASLYSEAGPRDPEASAAAVRAFLVAANDVMQEAREAAQGGGDDAAKSEAA